MLLEIDRLQLAVPSAHLAIERWTHLLGAELSERGTIKCLGAKVHTLRVGRSEVEILEPDGSGVVSDAVASRGAHMFSAGAASHDVGQVQAQLAEITDEPVVEDGRLYVDGSSIDIPGLRLVVSPYR